MNETYLDTARLLTQIAPFVFADGTFALKGGTAINLFIRDMPRLSVDTDLVFPDHSLPRDAARTRINDAIRQSAERLNAPGVSDAHAGNARCRRNQTAGATREDRGQGRSELRDAWHRPARAHCGLDACGPRHLAG